jgi:HD-GYP domain-containing protein (c-di-GMP phosphodiesterase class II)
MDIQPILDVARDDAVITLLRALDMHVPGESGHADRVAVYSVATGNKLGLDSTQLATLKTAAMLHDIGKMAVDRTLLAKLGTLTDDEFAEIKRHAHLAESVLEDLPWMAECLPIIRYHHERWDGQGYPDGLKGEAIPLGARIVAVAETYDHITAGSGWREPMDDFAATQEIARCAGTQFDPAVVTAFLEIQPIIQPVAFG